MVHSASNLLDFPDLIQSIGNHRRTGHLQVKTQDADIYWLVGFSEGSISSCSSGPTGHLYRAIMWVGLATRDKVRAWGLANTLDHDNTKLANFILDKKLLPADGIRDAIDCMIEQSFTDILSYEDDVDIEFHETPAPDPWSRYQRDIGTSIRHGPMLMEALRRRDELSHVGPMLHWQPAILIAKLPSGDLGSSYGEAEQLLLTGWNENIPVSHNFLYCPLAPWCATIALSHLLDLELLREATLPELVAMATRAEESGIEREHLLRRAAMLGADNPKILVELGKISLHKNDIPRAAQDFLQAGQVLCKTDINEAIAVLTHSLKCIETFSQTDEAASITPYETLQALLHCHQTTGDSQNICDILLKLAEYHERRDEHEKGIFCIREAQGFDADPIVCGSALGRMFIALNDIEQAVINLESVAHLSYKNEDTDTAAHAWRRILLIQPDKADIALQLSRYYELTDPNQAKVVIHQCLSTTDNDPNNEAILQLRELLADLDPSDGNNHRQLAQLYQGRKDRDSATAQLAKLAVHQKKNKQWADLAQTLERILELDPQHVDYLLAMAQAKFALGLIDQSGIYWRKATEAAIAINNFEQARTICTTALRSFPADAALHMILAAVAQRDADTPTAIKHFRLSSQLFLGTEEHTQARTVFHRLLALQPNNIIAACQLAEVNYFIRDKQSLTDLPTVVSIAERTNNLGLAVEAGRMLSELAPKPALDEREQFVTLLRKAGHSREELEQGQLLFSDMIAEGYFDRARSFQQTLITSNSTNGELLMQLAEVCEALDDSLQAIHSYQRAAVLLQQEGREQLLDDALNGLAELSPGSNIITVARQHIASGQALNWKDIEGIANPA